jgi:hypothetical protein
MMRRVVSQKFTDVSEVLTAFIVRAVWNFGQFLRDYMAKYTRRELPSYSPPLGSEIALYYTPL